MNKHSNLQGIVLLGVVLSLAVVLRAQRTPKTLVVNGKIMGSTVLQVDGRSYVDIETLVQLTKGSVKFESNRVVLTIPETRTVSATAAAAQPQIAQGLTKEFASVAVNALGNMKEWKAALETMVTFGLAVSPRWAQDYRDRAKTSLSEASIAATSASDHNALQLLNHQFASLAKWAGDLSAERSELNGARTVDPDSLRTDQALAKISDCDRFLNSMLVRGNYVDGSGCR
ncbi:MAG TPA: hypothetical protein VOA41_00285 [Candidatus Dormibacteraeota bacterium]|nr:hypothetical protein [Candidatus Dormibacteraeota bacterium]